MNPATPETSSTESSSSLTDGLILGIMCFVCFFWRLASVGLFDFNEGFYAQAAREMVLRGDWVAGSVNHGLFFDKPPLALWLSAGSFLLFGFNEFAARLPVALSATALAFLTYWFAARRVSRRAGVIAGAALAMSPLFIGTARQMTMDIHQSLWFSVAMVCYFEGYSAGSKRGKLWYYGFWVGCGVAFMAKSVPGLFPIAAAFVFTALDQRFNLRAIWTRIWEAKPLTGLAILILIAAPWHIAAYQKYGDYFYQEYWILHHVGLLTAKDFDHAQPFWYYVPALLAGMFPWSLFLPSALLSRSDSSAGRFALVWAVTVVLIFSVMKSKLISYLLPMYPAAALLIGDWLARASESPALRRSLRASSTAAALIALFLAGGAGFALWHFTRPGRGIGGDFPPEAASWAVPALGLLAIGAVTAAWLAWTSPRQAVWATIAGAFGFVTIAVEVGLGTLDREINRPLRELAREAGVRYRQGVPLAIHIASPRRPSIFFYLPDSVFRSGPIVERGEPEPILDFLSQERPAYVLADSGRAEKLAASVPGLRAELRTGRWVLLRAPEMAAELVSPDR